MSSRRAPANAVATVGRRGLRPTEEGLDDFDWEILGFVLRWAPYGGPPCEEILPAFGILSYELPERVREIVHRGSRTTLTAGERATFTKSLAAIDGFPSLQWEPE